MKLRAGPSRIGGPRAPIAWACSALIALGWGCERPTALPNMPPPAVTVAHPLLEKVMNWDEYSGRLEAVEFVDVRARVSGMINAVRFPEGALVKADDVLVEIDARPFDADLARAKAQAAESAARVELMQIEYKRLDELSTDVRSQTEYDKAVANLKAANAAREAAAAEVDAAKLRVEWCTIRAPIAGRISRRYVTPGNLITGGGQEATLLTTIASMDPIYCYMDADERSLLKYVRLKQNGTRASARDVQIPCYLQLGDETGFRHAGVIDFVDNRLDPGTGTIRARGIFANPGAVLLPGLFARARIPGSGLYETLLVPDAAVMSEQDKKLVMVVGDDGVVQMRAVILGTLFGELRAIQSGLKVSDRVVINGLMHARPGVRVAATEQALSVNRELLTEPSPESMPTTGPALEPATAPAFEPRGANHQP